MFSQPVTEIIRRRYSSRTYLNQPIAAEKQAALQQALAALSAGPLGAPVRLALAAATEQYHNSLRGLGTYGFIRNAAGFIVGAAGPGPKNLEDYGYALEYAILAATDLGLGTCWLGGTFTRSSFARQLALTTTEIMPAVAAIGYSADKSRLEKFMRRRITADVRLSWSTLFFNRSFDRPLTPDEAGRYETALEMVRLGPSASNKQPWRIIKDGDTWHFYLQRSQGYGGLTFKLLGVADLQRVDIGIAMSHFELTARELGLNGEWVVKKPDLSTPGSATEYVVSWRG